MVYKNGKLLPVTEAFAIVFSSDSSHSKSLGEQDIASDALLSLCVFVGIHEFVQHFRAKSFQSDTAIVVMSSE